MSVAVLPYLRCMWRRPLVRFTTGHTFEVGILISLFFLLIRTTFQLVVVLASVVPCRSVGGLAIRLIIYLVVLGSVIILSLLQTLHLSALSIMLSPCSNGQVSWGFIFLWNGEVTEVESIVDGIEE